MATHWDSYWNNGGVIDFSGSTDPRAKELERRVVLSFQFGVSGMTPRVHLNEHAADLVPTSTGNASADAGYRRLAETYFPSNGGLLLAVGLMAAGWDGDLTYLPGFPKQGWRVRAERLRPLP